MENETSIFKELEKISNDDSDSIERLNQISSLLSKEGMKIWFCHIYDDKRWSTIAGVDKMVIPHQRIRVGKVGGLIIENNLLNDEQWDIFKEILSSISRELFGE